MPVLADAYRHCAETTRKSAKNFYYAFVILPEAERRAMFALYTFCRVADDIVDEPGEPEAKRAGLAALRDALARCYDGRPEGPLFIALADVRERFGVGRRHLDDVVDGCAMDLEKTRYRSYEELARYLDLVSCAVGRATMEVFGLDPDERQAYALAGGQSVQLTNILRDVREDLERDRIYLPQDELERFGVTEEDLADGRMTDGFRALMAFQVERARGLYQAARDALPSAERRRLLPLTAISRLYERVLDRIEARGYDVFSSRASLSPWKKLQVGLGTWLRAQLGLSLA